MDIQKSEMISPLISILVPFKNTEKYLSDCLSSICEQSSTNWEVIAVNDSSTDQSVSIAHTFAEKDARITILQNNGNGIIDALKLAYSKSKGQLITRMDADDIMPNNKLEVLSKTLLQHGKKHIAIGQVRYFSEFGISDGYARYERWLNALTTNGSNFSELYKECVIPSPCWMVHREDLDACDAFNPNRYPEDYDLTFRFYQHQLRVIACTEVLHLWRDYATRSSRTHEHYAQNYFLDIKIHYFVKLNYSKNRPLILWGAGKKGKNVAQLLIGKNIPFYWVCDNPKKIGKDIYGVQMQHYAVASNIVNPQFLITVANTEAQKTILTFLKEHQKTRMKDYFFFC